MSLPVNKVSTADLVAGARALHLKTETPVFRDPFAHKLCGIPLRIVIRVRPLEWLLFKVVLGSVMPVHVCVIMRAKFAEEALEKAIEGGVRQYVIIGAGMDSFAFRRTDLAPRIDSFEIDHPVTQSRKLARIRSARLTAPARHSFVAADLSQVSVVDALNGSGFDTAAPTFLSMLGVAYYLGPDVLAATAGSIADRLPPGTRLVFDYLLDKESCDPKHLGLRQRMLDFVGRRGEPMRGSYSIEKMNRLMESSGLRPVENFPITDLEESYREEFGTVPFEIPGLFAFGTFEVQPRSS